MVELEGNGVHGWSRDERAQLRGLLYAIGSAEICSEELWLRYGGIAGGIRSRRLPSLREISAAGSALS
jgi:hypothetical protein